MDQKARHDVRAKPRTFNEGDIVFAKNYGSGDRWLSGKIVKVTGPVSFRVKLDDGRVHRYHQDQLRHQVVDDQLRCLMWELMIAFLLQSQLLKKIQLLTTLMVLLYHLDHLHLQNPIIFSRFITRTIELSTDLTVSYERMYSTRKV